MPAPYSGPIPKPTPETRPFWEAAKQRRLVIQACDDCGLRYFYPRPLCPGCLSRRVRWMTASGLAVLHTFVINHRPPRNYPIPPPIVTRKPVSSLPSGRIRTTATTPTQLIIG